MVFFGLSASSKLLLSVTQILYLANAVVLKITLLFFNQPAGAAEQTTNPEELKFIIILMIALAFLAIFGLVFVIRAYKVLKKQYRVIEQQHDEIAVKNKELAFINESLEELNMEKNNMISIVAHDLKAPLGNIQGLVELIKLENESLSSNQINYLDILNKVSKDSTQMVDIMLDVHKIESELHQMTLLEYDVVELINNVVKLNEPAAQLKKLNIDFVTELTHCKLHTDKQYFLQIVSNLVQNAIDFSPENKGIDINLEEDDKSVIITVSDQGPGMNDVDQKRLFSGYKNLEGEGVKGKSTGIGLAIVMRLLEKLHGRIEIDSELEHGSTFSVFLLKQTE